MIPWSDIEYKLSEILYMIRLKHPNFNSLIDVDKVMCHLYDADSIIRSLAEVEEE